MPTMAEILAAKRAASSSLPDTKTQAIAAVQPVEENKEAEVPKQESPKPLSFAEKMALKKMEEAKKTENGTITGSGTNTIPNEVPKASAPVPSVSQSVEGAAPIRVSGDTTTTSDVSNRAEDNPEVAQAYADIKVKIERLAEASDTDLKNAMKELKAALMKNPAAVSLMEDTDIGQMVIALRKITGEALVEAAKEKKAGRKPKEQIDLSDASKVAAIFDEL